MVLNSFSPLHRSRHNRDDGFRLCDRGKDDRSVAFSPPSNVQDNLPLSLFSFVRFGRRHILGYEMAILPLLSARCSFDQLLTRVLPPSCGWRKEYRLSAMGHPFSPFSPLPLSSGCPEGALISPFSFSFLPTTMAELLDDAGTIFFFFRPRSVTGRRSFLSSGRLEVNGISPKHYFFLPFRPGLYLPFPFPPIPAGKPKE